MHKVASKYFDIPSCRNRSRTIKADGVEITASLTPADFPHRAHLECSEDSLAVGFIYAMGGDEKRKTISNGPDQLEMRVGVDSGRVFRIRLLVPKGMEQTEMTSVSVRVEPNLRQLERQSASSSQEDMPPHRRIAHYKVMTDLMSMVDEKLEEMNRKPA